MKRLKRFESGQAIILLAVAMIGLLGMLGLALDGGRLYWIQRDSQNAADAGAMSGARAACANQDIEAAVRKFVKLNGYEDGAAVGGDPNITHKVDVTYWHEDINDATYVKVVVTAAQRNTFLSVIGPEASYVTVEAIGKCALGLNNGNTLITGYSTQCENSVNISGDDIRVDQGNILSATDVKITSPGSTINGIIGYGIQPELSNNLTLNPATHNPVQISQDWIPELSNAPAKWENFLPGSKIATDAQVKGEYYFITGNIHRNPQDEPLPSGLYVINGNFMSNTPIQTTGPVTIVASGKITVNAASIDLEPYVFDSEVGPILLLSNAASNCGNDAISLSSSSATWSGAIIAPYGGISFSMSDNSGIGIIWGHHVNISGSHILIADPRESTIHTHYMQLVL